MTEKLDQMTDPIARIRRRLELEVQAANRSLEKWSDPTQMSTAELGRQPAVVGHARKKLAQLAEEIAVLDALNVKT